MFNIPKVKPEGYFFCEMPPVRHIEKIIEAGNRNPSISQFYSVLISRKAKENVLNAPLEFVVCADIYKVVEVFNKKGEPGLIDEKSLLFIAIHDAFYALHAMSREAQKYEIAALYCDIELSKVKKIRKDWLLPDKVVPLVSLALGYPQDPIPEYVEFPREFIFFENEYPAAKDFLIDELSFHLDQEKELIDYYKHLDVSSSNEDEKAAWTWYDLLRSNCEMWGGFAKGFKQILKECGIKI